MITINLVLSTFKICWHTILFLSGSFMEREVVDFIFHLFESEKYNNNESIKNNNCWAPCQLPEDTLHKHKTNGKLQWSPSVININVKYIMNTIIFIETIDKCERILKRKNSKWRKCQLKDIRVSEMVKLLVVAIYCSLEW